MRRSFLFSLLLVSGFAGWAASESVPLPTKPAASKIVHVTVYQNTALVTREVEVPEGEGSMEVVVNPLPPQTIDGSLYSEGNDGLRILSTRFRQRPIQEDVREEVRKVLATIKELGLKREHLQAEQKVFEQNLALLDKLETFTAAKLTSLTEKGLTDAEQTLTLVKHIADKRKEYQTAMTKNQQEQRDLEEQTQFQRRKQQELSVGTSRVERDAVINLTKTNRAAGKLRLNYLVNSATWQPQYKFKASGKDKDPVAVEYLAAVRQQSGEDWTNVRLTLSTAQPTLNAAPPELRMLAMTTGATFMPANPGSGQAGGQPAQTMNLDNLNFGAGVPSDPGFAKGNLERSQQIRQQAQAEYNKNAGNAEVANRLWNESAALDQSVQLLATKEVEDNERKNLAIGGDGEGPSIAYHLGSVLSLPSRQDEQIVEVAKLELQPDFYYKAIPVLSKHVYRVARLANSADRILLPGEATMYINNDFVGRTRLPLVAIGEQFQVGFGVDPQLQVQRQLIDKNRTMQGANQVLRYDYRILASSYKPAPVRLQVWDRLPTAESEVVGISLVKATPEISKDALYVREERPKNLLRWDVELAPSHKGEQALAINYEFKLELDKQMRIGGFITK